MFVGKVFIGFIHSFFQKNQCYGKILAELSHARWLHFCTSFICDSLQIQRNVSQQTASGQTQTDRGADAPPVSAVLHRVQCLSRPGHHPALPDPCAAELGRSGGVEKREPPTEEGERATGVQSERRQDVNQHCCPGEDEVRAGVGGLQETHRLAQGVDQFRQWRFRR